MLEIIGLTVLTAALATPASRMAVPLGRMPWSTEQRVIFSVLLLVSVAVCAFILFQ